MNDTPILAGQSSQNHLSMVDGQGYLLRDQFGREDSEDLGIYCYVVGEDAACDDPDASGSVLNLMLPFGSIEEGVRTGGSYVIRYQKYPAQVLDVFYAAREGRRGHSFTAGEYESLMKDYTGDGS